MAATKPKLVRALSRFQRTHFQKAKGGLLPKSSVAFLDIGSGDRMEFLAYLTHVLPVADRKRYAARLNR